MAYVEEVVRGLVLQPLADVTIFSSSSSLSSSSAPFRLAFRSPSCSTRSWRPSLRLPVVTRSPAPISESGGALETFAGARLYYLDSITRVVGPMICTGFHGLRIQCKPDEFSGFNPPEGQTCGAWANEFVSAFGGYLDSL